MASFVFSYQFTIINISCRMQLKKRIKMKIIIAGAGEVGSYLAKMLSNENHSITVIEDKQTDNLIALGNSLDILTVEAYAASINVLKENKIEKTDLFIAVTPYETENITAALIAKQLGAKKTAARVDSIEYMQNNNPKFFENIGIDTLIYPELLAAKEVGSILRNSGISDVFEFSESKLNLFIVRVEKDAPIIGKTLIELSESFDSLNFRAVAISRDQKTIIPRGNDQFHLNDFVYFISTTEHVEKIKNFAGKESFEIKNVMILGGNKIAKKIALELENYYNLKLIEPDKEKAIKIADELDKTLVVNIKNQNIEYLIDEGIKEMDVFIGATGNSETNILSCVLAKQLGVKHTIAEVENIDYIDLANKLGIESVINKKLLAASHIYRHTTTGNISSVQCLTGTTAEILEFIVPKNAKITRKPLKEIKFPKSAIIGGIVRSKEHLIATGECKIEANDRVIVFCLPEAIKQTGKIFK